MIYYVYPSLSSFVKNDLDGFNEKYTVFHTDLPWGNKMKLVGNFIKQFFHLIRFLSKSKAYVVTFAGYHSFLPVLFAKIFRKKVFIILNGTDSVGIKELNYGSHLKTMQRLFCKFSLKHATELWPVSESLINGSNEFLNQRIIYGVQISFPKIKTPYHVIPNGFQIEKWNFKQDRSNDKTCVAVVSSKAQFNLKGIDLILEFAAKNPEFTCFIVGMEKPSDLDVSVNVVFKGKLTHESLATIYQSNTYYFQLSAFEGFGCSLCEAMLCGCIPIGSNVNMIPVIINNTGGVLMHKNSDELLTIIQSLELLSLDQKMNLSVKARNTIKENYPLKKRMDLIVNRLKVYGVFNY